MPTIEDLVPNIANMSRDELMERIDQIRGDRRISKHAKTERIAKQVKKKSSLQKALDALSPEEKAALLAELGE